MHLLPADGIWALTTASKCLLTGERALLSAVSGELLAEDLRQAQYSLSEITGEFSSEDLLGRIFQFLYWKVGVRYKPHISPGCR